VTGKDYPDWGGYPVSGQSYPLKDLAEAVVRLGSPVIYDRSGAVAFLDSFECGFNKWDWGKDPAASAPILDGSRACTGNFSLKLDPSAVAVSSIVLYHYQPVPVTSLWGISAQFAFEFVPRSLILSLLHYDGQFQHQFAVVFDKVTNLVRLRATVATYHDVMTMPNWYLNDYLFHHIKLVCDPVLDKYLRLNIDGTLYDLSSYSYTKAVSVTQPRVLISIQVVSDGAGQLPVWLDDVILTYNESD
jgi:hypothetical protein